MGTVVYFNHTYTTLPCSHKYLLMHLTHKILQLKINKNTHTYLLLIFNEMLDLYSIFIIMLYIVLTAAGVSGCLATSPAAEGQSTS